MKTKTWRTATLLLAFTMTAATVALPTGAGAQSGESPPQEQKSMSDVAK